MPKVDLLTPAGRLVAGSLYKENTTDAEGKPLVVKSGPNAGQPRVEFYFALAIPKKPGEVSWAQQAPWGPLIYGVGQAAFPQASQSPVFAWKIKDGDSTIPNKKGKRPCDQTGYPGHWVLSFSSGYPPKVVRDNGTVAMVEKDAVQLGDWVQVFGSVDGNGSQSQPGIYLNHSAVNFIAYGERISTGVDTSAMGFGQGVALPAGASLTPLAGSFTPAAAAAVAAGLPGAAVALPGAAVALPGAAAVALPVTQVQPHPGILNPTPGAPALPGAPAAPAVPAAPAARVMTAKAGGAPYESFIAQNWTDAMLVQHGYMQA